MTPEISLVSQVTVPNFSQIIHMSNPCDLKTRLIEHILCMRQKDEAYARWAMMIYHEQMPWLDLMNGIRDALRETSGQ